MLTACRKREKIVEILYSLILSNYTIAREYSDILLDLW